jgi:hypothetical protein
VGTTGCSLVLAALALGATAPAGYADSRGTPGDRHGGHVEVDGHAASAKQTEHAEHTERAKQVEHDGRAGYLDSEQPCVPAVSADLHALQRMKARHSPTSTRRVVLATVQRPTRTYLRPSMAFLLGQSARTTNKHASVLLGSRLLTETPLVSAPAVVVPETAPAPSVAVPETAPVPSVVVRPVIRPARPGITAQSLLDIGTAAAAAPRHVLAVRTVATTRVLVVQRNSRSATVRVQAPQAVSKELPRIGAWPAGPSTLTSARADLPLSLALGGLLLALAAARGVARMRHPRTDDSHLSFGAV